MSSKAIRTKFMYFLMRQITAAVLLLHSTYCFGLYDAPLPDFSKNEIQLEAYPGRLKLMLDSNASIYWSRLATPRPFKTEYYGLHILKKVTLAQIIADFYYDGYLAGSQSNPELVLSPSCKASILFNKDLSYQGRLVEKQQNLLWFHWDTASQLVSCVEKFYQILEKKCLTKTYLVDNPYYQIQKQVQSLIAKESVSRPIREDSDLDEYRNGETGVLLVPDYIHGDLTRYRQLVNILVNDTPDWFAIEMYPQSMQAVIDTFLTASWGSSQFNTAMDILIHNSWPQLNPENPHTKDNSYFKLLVLSKQLGIKVVALDTDIQYSLWNHGESAFGIAVRNRIWASALPHCGRGVLFGGSGHFFQSPKASNLQDFIISNGTDLDLWLYP